MRIVNELKEKIEKAEKSGKRYQPFVTLYNKVTGAKKLFPAIDAEAALELKNSKWSKTMPAATVESKPVEEKAEVPTNEAPATTEPNEKTYRPKRNRKISLDSQE
jgi:hypothetical protein